MKSRKFKAVLAAVSAIAVLATAMTGFAAKATITTVTTYNLDTSKASVTTTVSGLNDKDAEVTLLVSAPGAGVNGSGISYIDQKAASDGTAVFTYQLDKAALSDATEATVITGNDSANADDKIPDSDLNVEALTNLSTDTYTVAYDGNITHVGTETITASFTPVAGYEITKVTVGTNEYTTGFNAVPLSYVDGVLQGDLSVDVKATVQEPNLSNVALDVRTDGDNTLTTTLMQVVGNPAEVGVTYAGYTYHAQENDNGYVAVTLKAKTNNNIDADGIKAYYKVGNVITEVAINN